MSTAVGVLGFCAAWVAWVLAGYPLWLAWRARGRTRPAPGGKGEPAITAVIPVHNGGRFLAAKLDSVLGSNYPPERLDILVLSDASSDETDQVGQDYAARYPERVRFRRLARGGKAAALTAAWPEVSREIVLLTDVRQRLHPDCVRELAASLADPRVGAVSGNLLILKGDSAGEANVGLYWRYESWIRKNLGRVDSLLGATGPIYALRRELARPLPAGCILDDVWLPMQAVLAGYRATWNERAIAWDYPTDLGAEFARKVRTQAGLFQLLWQAPALFGWRNRVGGAFWSLKVGRLLLPEVLILALVASGGLAWPWNGAALGAQAAFYLLAGLDGWIAEGTALKRLSAPVRAFVVLLLAALCAVSIFFRRPDELWKKTRVRAPHSSQPAP
jgi:cellulose synthase/poly-beta-1,6-N-acetylglucosamine synthase-like glycosyltransferase